jgi:hypothetical protein
LNLIPLGKGCKVVRALTLPLLFFSLSFTHLS